MMHFNKDNIDYCSKYTSQQRCNYRHPPPIISSPVRKKKIVICYSSEHLTLYLPVHRYSGVTLTVL